MHLFIYLLADDEKISSLFELLSLELWLKAFLSIVDAFDCSGNKKTNPNVTVALSDRNVQLQSQMPTQQPDANTNSGAWDHKITRQSHETCPRLHSHGTCQLTSGHSIAAGLHGNLCNEMFPFYAKNILKSLFGTCVDISNIRGYRINPSLLCLCIVQHTDQHSGPQGSGAHGEFRAQALFWCFVWALFKREGILVFSVTDRPLCLRKHN